MPSLNFTFSGSRMRVAAALCGGSVLALMAAMPASAMTAYDTLVSNTATVDYKVGGVDQIQQSDVADFRVDQMVDVLVEGEPSDTTTYPGVETSVTFTVTNEGNATQGYDIDASWTGDFSLTQSSDPDNLAAGQYAVFLDVGGDGIYDAGVDTWYTADDLTTARLTDLDSEATTTISIVYIPPLTAVSTDTGTFELTANTTDAGTNNLTVATDPSAYTEDGLDIVFLDDAGTAADDDAFEGQHSAISTTSSDAPDLSVTKVLNFIANPGDVTDCISMAKVTYDGVTSAEQYVPGACVEYVITVTNAGDVAADTVVIGDDVPNEVSVVGVSFTNLDGPSGDTLPVVSDPVSATDASLPAGEVTTITIRALIL